MAKNIIKIIDSQDKVVSQTQVTSGKSVTVSAKQGQSYEFISGATKRAPDEIKTTREGNNLKVEIEDGDATSTVVVEDYYINGEGDLVGLAEDGHYYSFVPQEMSSEYMATDLADGVSSFQALGSEGDSMSPWWLALPLLALGAAGGGGGGGGDEAAYTLPAASITSVTDNEGVVQGDIQSGDVTDDATPTLNGTVSGALGDGMVLAIYRDGVKVGEVDATTMSSSTLNGKTITNWHFEDALGGDGKYVYTVRIEDGEGNRSTPSEKFVITLDTTAPDAPNVTMVTDDTDGEAGYTNWGRDVDTGSWSIDSNGVATPIGNVNVNSDGTIVTNDTTPTFTISEKEAGSTMEVYDYDAVAGTYTLVESTTTENLDGTWSVTINEETAAGDPNALSDGEHTLFLVERDAANNALDPENGTKIDMIIDTGRPSQNESVTLSDGENTRESDSPGGTASLGYMGMNKYFSNELIISDDVLNSSIFGDSDYNAGDSIYIKLTVTKEDGTTVTYLIGGPDGPTTTISNDGDPWSVTINNTNAYNVASGAYENLVDGEYTAEIVISDLASNTRAVGVDDFAIDTTAPTANNVEYVGAVNNNSSVIPSDSVVIGGEIADYEKLDLTLDNNDNGVAERDIDYLTGTTAAEIFIYRDGEEVGSKYVGTYEGADNWSFTDTPPENGVYKYDIKTMDVAGNSSDSTEAFWAIVDDGDTNNYDLREADDAANNDPNGIDKDFEHMILVGDDASETFIVDSVGFGSIDGGAGKDTLQFDADLMLDGSSGDITGFEVFDVGSNTLTISNDTKIESDIYINGESGGHVVLDTTYWTSFTQITDPNDGKIYDVYTHDSMIINIEHSLLA